MENKKRRIILSLIISVSLLLIIIGALNIKKDQEIKFRSEESISDILVEETHYIDKSLIKIPTTVPFETVPSNIDKNEIIIMSDNSEVVKVNDDNTITALKIGEANLTLIAKENNKITAGLHIIIE